MNGLSGEMVLLGESGEQTRLLYLGAWVSQAETTALLTRQPGNRLASSNLATPANGFLAQKEERLPVKQ